jgi:parallel beta-helix repeat protein
MSDGNRIFDNLFSNNGNGIMNASYLPPNVIYNNSFSYNHTGISLLCYYDSIIGNTITNNSSYGISIDNAYENTIIENVIQNNPCGIRAIFTENNSIYHNYIYDDVFELNIDLPTNDWDDGYPSGGNYWSDYIGDDVFQGEGQNIPGADGIGDTPYVINDNQDHYPFMNPDGWLVTCGDANGDYSVTPGDGYFILNYFGASSQPIYCWIANVNGDSSLTTADGYHLLNFFGTGSELTCGACQF